MQSMTVRGCFGLFWVVNCIICETNCIVMCMRLVMAMNFGFHEVKSTLASGLK